jgi:hypothetical protein
VGLLARVANDYTIVDDPEALTYTVVKRTGNVNHAITHGFRAELDARELAASAGVYTGQDQIWFIPRTLVTAAAVAPKLADLITDPDGQVWTVLEASPTGRQYWRFVCRNFVLSADLRNTLAHKRPANKADTSGGRRPELADLATGIPCRVQETSRNKLIGQGRAGTRVEYAIYVGTRLYPDAQDVFEDESGVEYEFVAASTPDRIDLLQELTCERIL